MSDFLEGYYFEPGQANFRKLFGLILVDGEDSEIGLAFQSVIHGDLEKIEEIVTSKPSVIYQTDKLGRTLLHAFVDNNDGLKLLEERNIELKGEDTKEKLFKKTPLEIKEILNLRKNLRTNWNFRLQ